MNSKTYRPRRPSTAQKEAAHSFYAQGEKGDAPPSDLLWSDEQHAAFRRETGLEDAAEQVRCRPSRSQTYASGTVTASDVFEHAEVGAFNGQLRGRDAVLEFVRAGNATLTIVSKATGTRYTYKFQRPKNFEPSPMRPYAPVFCKVLTGADNEGDFEFVGTMWPEHVDLPDGAQVYRHGKSSRITLGAPSVKALVWFIRNALHPNGADALDKCEVWHEGRCGRCGRKLTVPSSVESGYGPECIGRL